MLKRVGAFVGALGLLVAMVPILAASPAQAVGVTAICAPQSGSLIVRVGDTIVIGVSGTGCVLEDTAGGGAVESQDLGVFLAVAPGSATIQAFTADDFGSYTNTWSVKVKDPEPSPSPTLTPSPTLAPTPAPTASPSATGTAASPAATTSPTEAPVPLVPADASAPRASQRLTQRNVEVTSGLKRGQVAFFGPDGMPLQLLSLSGDTDGIAVVDPGINYSTRPANWQRLAYGDTCWSYAGYSDVQGFVLPVATPPYSTVTANWLLTAAILGTTSGNVTFVNPKPGQTVDAGGRAVATLTLCAKGYPNAISTMAADERSGLRSASADKGGGQYNTVPGCTNGQATGNKHCTGSSTFPTYTGTVGATGSGVSTPRPTATTSATPTPEPTVTICRATVDPLRPYVRETAVPLSRLPQSPAAGETLFPATGWTSIIPRTPFYAGQNWTTAGREIFDRGCTVVPPTPTPEPTLTPTPRPTPTPTPAPILTPKPDPLIAVCRATKDRTAPYRLESVRESAVVPTGGSTLYPTVGWTDILPPTGAYPAGQNWPAGAALLREAKCAVTFVAPEPVQTISGFGPGPQTSTPPPITGWGPAIVVTPIPQPSFTGYGTVTPWPPLQPVPLHANGTNPDGTPSLVPTPYPTPTPTPTLTPTAVPPSPTPTLTPTAVPPSPTPTPTPTLTPPTPTITVMPIAQPSFVDFGPVCGTGPCQITPVQAPNIPWTALITVTDSSSTTPTPSPTASPSASPSATPLPTPTTPTPSTGTGKVTLVLTNGPDTVSFTTTVDRLLTVALPTGSSTTPTATPSKKPTKPTAVAAGRSRMGVVPTS